MPNFLKISTIWSNGLKEVVKSWPRSYFWRVWGGFFWLFKSFLKGCLKLQQCYLSLCTLKQLMFSSKLTLKLGNTKEELKWDSLNEEVKFN